MPLVTRFEDKDFQEMDIEQVRASTPLRKMSPTPLDRHRSREPSPFVMPKLKLGSGTITPGGSKPPDPHTFFSRSSSSQSLHQGGGTAATQLDFDSFRAAMEAKQAEDDSLPQTSVPQTMHSHSMRNLSWKGGPQNTENQESGDHLGPENMFSMERPGSAMSEMSIDLPSRAESRMDHGPLGDAISQGNLNIHSNFSSRRGSAQPPVGMKDVDNKFVSSWLEKTNQVNFPVNDEECKTPVPDTKPEFKPTTKGHKNDISDLESELKVNKKGKEKKSSVDSSRIDPAKDSAEKAKLVKSGSETANENKKCKFQGKSSEEQKIGTTNTEGLRTEQKEEVKKEKVDETEKVPERPKSQTKVKVEDKKSEEIEEKKKPAWKRPGSKDEVETKEADSTTKATKSETTESKSSKAEEEMKVPSSKRPTSKNEKKLEEVKFQDKSEEVKGSQEVEERKVSERPKSQNNVKVDDMKSEEIEEKKKPLWKRPGSKNEGEIKDVEINTKANKSETEEAMKILKKRPSSKTEDIQSPDRSKSSDWEKQSTEIEEKKKTSWKRPEGKTEGDTKLVEESKTMTPTEQKESSTKDFKTRTLTEQEESSTKDSMERPKTKMEEMNDKTKNNESVKKPKGRTEETDKPKSITEEKEIQKGTKEESADEVKNKPDKSVEKTKTKAEAVERPKSRTESTERSMSRREESTDRLKSRTEEKGRPKSRTEETETPKNRAEEKKLPKSSTEESKEGPKSKAEAMERPKSRTESTESLKRRREESTNRQKSRTEEKETQENRAEKIKIKNSAEQKEKPEDKTEEKERAKNRTKESVERPKSKIEEPEEEEPQLQSWSRPKSRTEDVVEESEIVTIRKSAVSPHQKEREMLQEIIAEGETDVSDKRKRTFSRSSSCFEQTEPAEWVQGENDEDELMIILDTDNYVLEEVDEEEETAESKSMAYTAKKTSHFDDDTMNELELQYENENGRKSRPMSPYERPASILKGCRNTLDDRVEEQSRPASRNSFKDTSAERKKISFDDDFHPDVTEQAQSKPDKSRSQSKERPSSRSSVGSGKGILEMERERKKSSSLVPELETLEIPSSLKEKLDKMEQLEPPVRSERKDSPRPPSRPSSTGFSHLDEFERKLAEMEDELEQDDKLDGERPLSRGSNMWNLVDEEMARENLHAGHIINQEKELDTVDHSMILDDEEDTRSKKVSFAAADERIEIERQGQVRNLGKNLYALSPPKPMKKLPGKESITESYKLPANDHTTKEKTPAGGETPKGFFSSLRRSRSKTPDTEKESGSLFGSLLRKGRKSSRSGSRQSSMDRESQELGSDIEGRISRGSDTGSQGSLVMKLKNMGKKKPQKVSETDFDELFARGRAMNAINDSETNISDKKQVDSDDKKRKIFKDDSIDYNEKVQAFLEDQAKSAAKYRAKKEAERQIKEKQLKADFKLKEEVAPAPPVDVPPVIEKKMSTYAKPEEIKLSPTIPKRDIFTGKPLPQNPDEEFLERISNFVTNYSQKSNYEQIWPATPTPKPARRSHKKSSASTSLKNSKQSLTKNDSVKNSNNSVNEFTSKLDKISASDEMVQMTNEIIVPSQSELDFLEKVSSFVTKYADDEDYSQKMWPQKDALKPESKKKKTMSPGRSYLEHKGEAEWFARSIEADSYEAQKQVDELERRKHSNSLSGGASVLNKHLAGYDSDSSVQPSSPPRRQNIRISSSQPPELSGKPGPQSSQSQMSSQEFYTKLVIGLQKYTTPEPESRATVGFPPQLPLNLKKAQSDTIIRPVTTVITSPNNEKSTSIPSRFLDQSLPTKAKDSPPLLSISVEDKNAEFYNKLVTGLKTMTSEEGSSDNKTSDEADTYRKYSHNLGRAEFGTLKRTESTGSKKSSNLKQSNSVSKPSRYSQESPGQKKKISRQDSGEKYVRGMSRMSDTSETMPDLEVDEELEQMMSSRMRDNIKKSDGNINLLFFSILIILM